MDNLSFTSTAYWVFEAEINLKKINPKVVKVTIALMSVLLAGGAAIAVKEVLGGTTAEVDLDDTGAF